jgi:hypothetical protein
MPPKFESSRVCGFFASISPVFILRSKDGYVDQKRDFDISVSVDMIIRYHPQKISAYVHVAVESHSAWKWEMITTKAFKCHKPFETTSESALFCRACNYGKQCQSGSKCDFDH